VPVFIERNRCSDHSLHPGIAQIRFEHYKPDREIYTGVAKFFNVPDSEVMLVAAHNSDLGAAKSFGLKTAFIPRPTEYGAEQTTDLKPQDTYNYVASSVEDLAQQLGA
jgi:2-haloacid dehalogenase